MIELRGGQVAKSRRLDRIPQWDPANEEFPIEGLLRAEAPLQERRWRLFVRQNQGQEGACVEYGWCHELSARPDVVPAKRVRTITKRHLIYWRAQEIDPWPGGMYEGASPRYEGTSVLAGAKATAELGLLKEYRWALGENAHIQVARHISQKGGCVLGLDWYAGMSDPGRDGIIKPTGDLEGGHCVAALALRRISKRWYVGGPNSWDDSWGDRGWWWMALDDLGQLLADGGDACMPVRS